MYLEEGGREVGYRIFGFADFAKFWFPFSASRYGFSALLPRVVFGFFSNLVFSFRFLSITMAVFWIFQPNVFYYFSIVLPRKLHSAVELKL